MKKQLLFVITSVVGINMAFAQPIVKVWGSDDSLAHVTQIRQWLEYLDVHETICLQVSFVTALPKSLEGTTFTQKTPASDGHQLVNIIKVWIDRGLSKARQKLALAHEMIHVKQYAKKELTVINKQIWWQGRKFYDHYNDHVPTPWEREAYSLDDKLAKICESPTLIPTASLSSY